MTVSAGPSQRRGSDQGFTLIELLIVIIIIGVLAAIALPALMRQREKAWDVAVESDLRNAAMAQDAYLTDGGPGLYATTVEQLVSIGFRPSSESQYFGGQFAMAIGTSGADYCLTARSRSGRYLGYGSLLGITRKATPIDAITCV
jgi:type IV pilus assembly protein PilA